MPTIYTGVHKGKFIAFFPEADTEEWCTRIASSLKGSTPQLAAHLNLEPSMTRLAQGLNEYGEATRTKFGVEFSVSDDTHNTAIALLAEKEKLFKFIYSVIPKDQLDKVKRLHLPPYAGYNDGA